VTARSRARGDFGCKHVQQQVEGGRGERMHVAEAITAAGFERDCALGSPYRLPEGPVAPLSATAHVAEKRCRAVCANSRA